MDQDLVATADKTVKKPSYSLDQVTMLWQEYQMRRQRMEADKAFCDEFTQTLKGVCGDADEFTFQGKKVATLVLGQLNVTRLAEEQPELHEEYMRRVTKLQFDRDALKKERPDVYEEYQARRFCVTGE